MARFYGFSHKDMLNMSYRTLLGYLANIENLEAEEALTSLKVSSNPKPVYIIEAEKNKSAIRELEEILINKASGDTRKPYYLDEEIDHKGLARLKEALNQKR